MIIMIIFYFLSEFISARIKYFAILIKNPSKLWYIRKQSRTQDFKKYIYLYKNSQ